MGACGLLFGLCFGFVLVWAGVADDVTVQAMLHFKEPHLYLMLGSAVLTAGILVRVLRAAKVRAILEGNPVQWEPVRIERRHLVGGAMFGAAWGITGSCPGPMIAMVGQGRLLALVGVAGILVGIALARRRLEPQGQRQPVALGTIGQ